MFPTNFQVIYETKGSGDEMMMSSSEVVVANEEEVEHDQVTIHYINADGTPRELFVFVFGNDISSTVGI